MLRDADTSVQAPKGQDARPSGRYADASGGHGIHASLRVGGHRLRRGTTSHHADGGRNGATARGMQIATRHVPDASSANRKRSQQNNPSRDCGRVTRVTGNPAVIGSDSQFPVCVSVLSEARIRERCSRGLRPLSSGPPRFSRCLLRHQHPLRHVRHLMQRSLCESRVAKHFLVLRKRVGISRIRQRQHDDAERRGSRR